MTETPMLVCSWCRDSQRQSSLGNNPPRRTAQQQSEHHARSKEPGERTCEGSGTSEATPATLTQTRGVFLTIHKGQDNRTNTIHGLKNTVLVLSTSVGVSTARAVLSLGESFSLIHSCTCLELCTRHLYSTAPHCQEKEPSSKPFFCTCPRAPA